MAKLLQRISLEPCNLGLEQIEENDLNLEGLFPAQLNLEECTQCIVFV